MVELKPAGKNIGQDHLSQFISLFLSFLTMMCVQDQVCSNHLFVIECCLFVFDEVTQFLGELILQSSLDVYLDSLSAANEKLGPVLPDLVWIELLSNDLLGDGSHILNHW